MAMETWNAVREELDRALTRAVLGAVVQAAEAAGRPPTRTEVARLLAGAPPRSRAGGVAGALSRLGTADLREGLDFLGTCGLLERAGGVRAHIRLTPHGEEYLRGRIARGAGLAARLLARPLESGNVYPALRALRKKIALEEGRSPFFILSERTLRALAARLPATYADLEAVPGIGPARAAKYGERILEQIREAKGASPRAAPAADPWEAVAPGDCAPASNPPAVAGSDPITACSATEIHECRGAYGGGTRLGSAR